MSVFDWVAMGCNAADSEAIDKNYPGSFAVTAGDALGCFYGSRTAHIIGPDIKLMCDPEDILAGLLPEKLNLLAGLLGGISGNVTFCYGSNLTATYIGPKGEIRRGESWSKVSESLLGTAIYKGPGAPAAGKPEAADAATDAAVFALSVLMLLTTAALEIAAKITYPHDSPKFALASGMISSRLMALMKELERCCSLAEFAELYLEGAGKLNYIVLGPLAFVAALVTVSAIVPVGVVATIGYGLKSAGAAVVEAVKSA
jgi:hypothetical protein